MVSSRITGLLSLFAIFLAAESVIIPCKEYNSYAQYHTYTAYTGYYYSCGWWNWGSCYGTYSYTAYYVTYYSQLDCCGGHGGSECIPICSPPCGTNKECSAPNTCTCIEGWEGSDCLTDIDECDRQTDICEYHETCVNTAGSYNCDCPDNADKLALDGRRCISPVTNLWAKPGRRDITLYWNHPRNFTIDGTFDRYDIECIAEFNTTVIANTYHTTGWDESFIVSPITPFRNYTCSVTPVTVSNGAGHPTKVKLETLQDKPDGPPRDVAVTTIDSKILEISWVPPEVPNGIISYHRLYIDYTNTTRIYELEVDPQYNIFFLEFLYPHQRVGISVSATTGGGEGPSSAYVFNKTNEAEPGRVSDIAVAIINDNSAQVIWIPPETLNGIVLSYHIYLYKVEGGVKTTIEEWELDYDDELSVKVFNLSPYIPYEFVVIAATKAGKGEIAPFRFFTKEDVPKVSPAVSTASRSSANEVYVTWGKLNADDLQGFFVDYIVKYYTSAVNSDCSSPMDEKTETTTNEWIILKDLDPHTAYCVKVAAASTTGAGPYTDLWYIDEFENSKFELHLIGVHDCEYYVHDDAQVKLDSITDQLTDVLNRYCMCAVQTNYFGDIRFICAETDGNRVIFQGSIIGTPTAGSIRLVEYLEQWKDAKSHLVVKGLQLYVNDSCEVALDDFGSHTQCNVPTSESGAVVGASDASTDIGPYVGGIVGAIAAAVIIVIVVLIVVIAVAMVRRSGKESMSQVKFVNSSGPADGRVGVSNPISGNDEHYDEKELLENMD